MPEATDVVISAVIAGCVATKTAQLTLSQFGALLFPPDPGLNIELFGSCVEVAGEVLPPG